jgi:hypothetical protein
LVVEANKMSGLETIVQEALTEQNIVTGSFTDYRLRSPIRPTMLPRRPTYTGVPIRFPPQPIESSE